MKWLASDEVPTNPTRGAVYEIEVGLWKTAYVFDPSHRIRVSLSSSNFPRLRTNKNNGLLVENEDDLPVESATNTFYVGADYPSRLTLPVVTAPLPNANEALRPYIRED